MYKNVLIIARMPLHYAIAMKVVMDNLKLKFRQYPAMQTNRMLYHCNTLQYNNNIWHGSYAEAKF